MLTETRIKRLFSEVRPLFNLTVPLVASGFVESSIGFFSTLFLAHLGKQELAAGALVAWVFATLMVVMWGTLSAVSALIARHYGEKDNVGVANILRNGLWLAILSSFPVMLLLWNLPLILPYLGQDKATVALATPYIHGLTWGVFPDFILTVLLHFLMGLGKTRTNLFFNLLWVPINIAANYSLMFGKWGLPALGIAGIGWGTTITFWIMTFLLGMYIFKSKLYKPYIDSLTFKLSFGSLKELLRMGLPLGAMFTIEIGFFMTVSLLMGFISQDALAANQIALQYLAQISVVTFAIAQAITIRIGHTIGAGEKEQARRGAYLGIMMAFLFMLIIAIVYWSVPDILIALDLDVYAEKNRKVVELARQFLAICAVFQILETARIATFGALRALKDTQYTMWVSIITFWVCALPLGYVWAVWLNWQGAGIWWAMVVSQIIGSAILLWRFHYKMLAA
jgi:MATE family multidrug resistance protein